MAEKKLTFEGYWSEDALGDAPKKGGIFCVYKRGLLKSAKKLLYIAETTNAKNIAQDAGFASCKDALGAREKLFVSFAPVRTKKDRTLLTDALIHAHNPPVNGDAGDFGHGATNVSVSGQAAGLKKSFSVG